jgi:pyridoxine 5-phosphate synthase
MPVTRCRLGVNIDHVATLREVRGTDYPDMVRAAALCEAAGATGITVHLREDRRHIQDRDVYALRRSVTTRLNLEMANLVPERRRELTTEGGLDAAGQERRLAGTVERLARAGIAVSLFIAPDPRQVKAAARLGVPYIELHTGTFCDCRGPAARTALRSLKEAARLAHSLGLKVNAGHGINLRNVGDILQIPYLDTLNIGHSIVCDAVFSGLDRAVRAMLAALKHYRGGAR